MFPLGLAFIQIIHRPCTVQTLILTGLHWQLSQPYPHSDHTTDAGRGGGRLAKEGGTLNHSNTLMGTETPIAERASNLSVRFAPHIETNFSLESTIAAQDRGNRHHRIRYRA